MRKSNATVTEFPRREGPAPRVTISNPQMQLDQIPEGAVHDATFSIIASWPGVLHQPSRRAPIGTIGLYLDANDAQGPEDAFLLGHEFAHLHPLPDGSLHMTLAPLTRIAAMKAGWGVPHRLAGLPTVSPMTTLIFAPRDAGERDIVISLVAASEAYARAG